MHDPRSDSALRRRRLASRARTLAGVYLVVLFLGTHLPPTTLESVSYADKWVHFGGYAVLTVCVLAGWELTIGVLRPKHFFAVWLAGTLYGAVDEMTQIPVGRTCDVNDWAADVLGIVAGLLAYQFASAGLRRLTKWRVAWL